MFTRKRYLFPKKKKPISLKSPFKKKRQLFLRMYEHTYSNQHQPSPLSLPQPSTGNVPSTSQAPGTRGRAKRREPVRSSRTNREPATMKAVTGSKGFHLYFSRSGTIGLNRRNNFSGLRVDGALSGIDGRGVGGLLFAPPSRYTGMQKETKSYSWAPGGDGVPQPMPAWLVGVINASSFGASSPVAAELSNDLSTAPLFASANAGVLSSSSGGRDMTRPSGSKGLRCLRTLGHSCKSSRQC
jgi:hypothetical protein